MSRKQIMILGIGNLLFTDEGFGIRVIQKLLQEYTFPENVSIQDGGVLGVNLLGIISEADHLIVVDAVRNGGCPGDIHRLNQNDLPGRIRSKNSLHQVDFIEALTLCQALEKVPETVVFGVEPEDIETFGIELTPTTSSKIEPVISLVLAELTHLGIAYKKGATPYVSCDPLKNHQN